MHYQKNYKNFIIWDQCLDMKDHKMGDKDNSTIGVEMIGLESPYVDVEAMVLAVTVVEALGLNDVKLHINSLGDEESRNAYREALKEHFKPVLNDLCYDCQQRYEKNPLRILDCKVDKDHPAMNNAPHTIDYLSESAKAHFDKVCELLDDLEIEYVIDTNLVRGLDYYSHTVFEVISDDPKLGAGSTVGGGGRYNTLSVNLVDQMFQALVCFG